MLTLWEGFSKIIMPLWVSKGLNFKLSFHIWICFNFISYFMTLVRNKFWVNTQSGLLSLKPLMSFSFQVPLKILQRRKALERNDFKQIIQDYGQYSKVEHCIFLHQQMLSALACYMLAFHCKISQLSVDVFYWIQELNIWR